MSASKIIKHQPNQASYSSTSNYSSVQSTSSNVKNNHPVSNSSSNPLASHSRTVSSAGFGVKSFLNLLDAGSNPNTKAKISTTITKKTKVSETRAETKTTSSKYNPQTSTLSSQKLVLVQKLPYASETQFFEKKSMTVSDPYKILKEAKPFNPPIKIPPRPSENQILVNSKVTKELFKSIPFSISAALGEKVFENKAPERIKQAPTEIVKVSSVKISAQSLQKLEERRKRYQTKVEEELSKINEDSYVNISQNVKEPEKIIKRPAEKIQQSNLDKNTKTGTYTSIFSKNRSQLQKLVPTVSKPENKNQTLTGATKQGPQINQQALQEEKSSGISKKDHENAPIKNSPKNPPNPFNLPVNEDSSKSTFSNAGTKYKYHYRNSSSTPSQEERANNISEAMPAARRVYTSESEDLKEAYIELGPGNSDPEKNMDLSFDLENSSQFTSSANTKALQKFRKNSSADDDDNEMNPDAGLLTERIYQREEDSPLASLSKLDVMRTLKKSKSETYVQEGFAEELERKGRGRKISKTNNHLKVPPLNLAIKLLSRNSNGKPTEDSFRDSKSDVSRFVEVIQENNTEFVDLLQKMNLTKTGGENILLNEDEEQLLKNILDFIHNKDNFVSKEEAYSYRQKISDLERKLDSIASQNSFAILKDNDDENSYRDVSLQDVEGMSPRSDNRPSTKKKSLFVPSTTINPMQINIIAASPSASALEESGNNKTVGSVEKSSQIHTPNLPGTFADITSLDNVAEKSQEEVGKIHLDTVGNIDHPGEMLRIPRMRGSIELPANSPHFKTFTPSFKSEKAPQGLALENHGISFGAHHEGNTPLMSPLSLSGTKQITINLNPSEENNNIPMTKSLSIIDALSNPNPPPAEQENPMMPILDTQLGPPPLLESLLDPNFKPSSNSPQREFVTDNTLQSPPDLFELFKRYPNDTKGLHLPEPKFKIRGEPITDSGLPSPPDFFELFKRHPNDTKGLHLPEQKFRIRGEPIADTELPSPPDLFELFKRYPNDTKGLHLPEQKFRIRGEPITDSLSSPPDLYDLFKRHPNDTKGLLHMPKQIFRILGEPIIDKELPPPPVLFDLFKRHPTLTKGLLHTPKPVLKILGTPILDKLSPPPSIIDLFQRHPNVAKGLNAPQAKSQQANGMPSRPNFLAELANRFKPGELNGQLRPGQINQTETKKKLKAVFIEKMNPESLKGTVYGEIHNSEHPHPTISFEDLHDLFENAPPQKPSATEQTQPKKPEAKSLITDAKRKHNISIMIMKFRKWSLPQLKEGIINFDPEILTPDACSTLLPFCLLPDEIRACQSNKDPVEKLDPASQFLLTLSEIPQMGPRLRCTILKSEFHQRFNTISENFNKLKAGCEALRNNPYFKVFLKLSLDVANTLNEGTTRGAAMGLKPASLLSFDTVRSNKPGMTLLVYMLKKIYEQKQEILKFTEDFIPINEAVKINVDDLVRNLMEIKNEVEQVKIHLASSTKQDPPDTTFIDHFTPFYEENCVLLAEALENSHKIKAYYIETAKFLGEDDESLKKKNSTEFFKVFKQLSDTVRKFKTDEDERRKREARKLATAAAAESLKKKKQQQQDPPC